MKLDLISGPTLTDWAIKRTPLGNGCDVQTIELKIEKIVVSEGGALTPFGVVAQKCEALEYALIEAWKELQQNETITRS